MGFLPEALCNYLLRLGWGHGDAEILSREEAIRLFDLDGVGRAASRMDYAKLTHLNGVYLRQAYDARLARDVVTRLGVHSPEVAGRIEMLMPALKERAKTLLELADSAAFLAHIQPLQPKASALLTGETRPMLHELGAALARTDFSAPALDAALRDFAEAKGIKLGALAQPLRAALTGSTSSPPIDATLAALGRDESLSRIAAVA